MLSKNRNLFEINFVYKKAENVDLKTFSAFFSCFQISGAIRKNGFTTLRIYTILCNIVTNTASTKIRVNVAGTGFVETCIKSCINNVPLKKAQTLSNQRLCLFHVFPNFYLGTLLE